VCPHPPATGVGAERPDPFNLTDIEGSSETIAGILKLDLNCPGPIGENLTTILQLSPGLRVAQSLDRILKGGESDAIGLIVTLFELLFTTFTALSE
jgi:hypothetical protein